MKFINRYKIFLEKYNIQQDENVALIDKKNHFNTLEAQIREYESGKSSLETIYNTFLDRKDLINRLQLGKFIEPTQQQEISYKNPLFSSYSSILDLKRKIKDLETFKSQTLDQTKENEKKEKIEPEISQELEDQSELLKTQTKKKDDQINLFKRRVSEQEAKHQKYLTDSKKKLSDLRIEIDNFK